MAKYKDTASETETRQPRMSKARTAAAQQAQQEYLARHINSNGPQDRIKPEPLDFHSFSDQTLTNYNTRYQLNYPPIQSLNADVLQSDIGKKSQSYKKLKHIPKVTKAEYANNLKKHFINTSVKENEVIANFLYKVSNENNEFKLSFK